MEILTTPRLRLRTLTPDDRASVAEALQDENFGIIYHNCGNSVSSMLEPIFAQGAAAYHFGNAVEMKAVLAAAPEDVLCMGNIDPAGQFAMGTPDSIRAATKALLADCGGCKTLCPLPAATFPRTPSGRISTPSLRR